MQRTKKIISALLVVALGLASYSNLSTSDADAMKKQVEIDKSVTLNDKSVTVKIVGIQDIPFTPSILNIESSTKVIFLNVDGSNGGRVHTITSTRTGTIDPDGKFDSGLLNVGDKFEFTFTERGLYEYFDSLNPSIRGIINVK